MHHCRNHDEPSPVNVTIAVHAPVLLAYPGVLNGLPGDQGVLNVQAYIPGSTQGLSWHITSKPDWLALSTMQGFFAYPLEKVYSHGPEWICLWAEWSYYR